MFVHVSQYYIYIYIYIYIYYKSAKVYMWVWVCMLYMRDTGHLIYLFFFPFCSMLSRPLILQKPTGPTSSGSSSSARAKSQSFRSHHRPGRRQMANQEGKIPASGKAARGPQKQVARKRTGKGIEIGSFEEPQQMSYASDQPSQYHSSPAQGATARQQNHAATAFPSAEIKQSGPGMRNEAAYADANAHLESSSGDVGIELRPSDSPLKPPYDGMGDDKKHGRRSKMVSN